MKILAHSGLRPEQQTEATVGLPACVLSDGEHHLHPDESLLPGAGCAARKGEKPVHLAAELGPSHHLLHAFVHQLQHLVLLERSACHRKEQDPETLLFELLLVRRRDSDSFVPIPIPEQLLSLAHLSLPSAHSGALRKKAGGAFAIVRVRLWTHCSAEVGLLDHLCRTHLRLHYAFLLQHLV